MQMNMEVLEADFMQMALNEESEGHNNCFDDEKEFGHIARDDPSIEVNFTKDIDDIEKLIQKKNENYCRIANKLIEREGDRNIVISELSRLSLWNYLKAHIAWRRKEIENLQQCLNLKQREELRGGPSSKNTVASRGGGRGGRRRLIIIGKRPRQSSAVGNHHVVSKFKDLPSPYTYSYGEFYAWRREVEHLQQCLQEIHSSKNPSRRRPIIGTTTYSQEENLNCYIKSLTYQMQHGSESLTEEKKLLREIKQNEAKRDELYIVNDASKEKQIPYNWGSRKDIRKCIQFTQDGLKKLEKKDQIFTTKMKHLKQELKAIESNITSLQMKLEDINREKHEAYEYILQLKKKDDEALL